MTPFELERAAEQFAKVRSTARIAPKRSLAVAKGPRIPQTSRGLLRNGSNR